MPNTTKTSPVKPLDYKKSADAVLKSLRRDREREVLMRRFGLGMVRRQTLEQIGKSFGITRERVRQIEKSTIQKLKLDPSPEAAAAGTIFDSYLKPQGGVAQVGEVAAKLGAGNEQEKAYIIFLANMAPGIAVIDEDDQLHTAIAATETLGVAELKSLAKTMASTLKEIGSPVTLEELAGAMEKGPSSDTLEGVARVSKKLVGFEGRWGLESWPEVNPKSIRDKTYLVMGKHGKPLHFSQIAEHIGRADFARGNVTVQAVHNELIKDPRFILVGRGIYALAEWGYAAGTVADIINDILADEAGPLHKDEIIKRVLKKRQVKSTTIVLNLQEKDQFVRVAKATYKLKGK